MLPTGYIVILSYMSLSLPMGVFLFPFLCVCWVLGLGVSNSLLSKYGRLLDALNYRSMSLDFFNHYLLICLS